MNKNFKVVFSKARGALMVVNELTSSVQAKGTKTVIAATVASLVAGGAIAKEIPYEQASGNSGYSATTAENLQMEFEADNVLNMTITGKVDTRAYGLPIPFTPTRARSTSILRPTRMPRRLIASRA